MFKCEKMLNHTSCVDMIIGVNYFISKSFAKDCRSPVYVKFIFFTWNALLQRSLNVINIDLCFAKMLKQGQINGWKENRDIVRYQLINH